MEHSPKFAKLKLYFEQKLWNEAAIRTAVTKGWITEAECKEILGEQNE